VSVPILMVKFQEQYSKMGEVQLDPLLGLSLQEGMHGSVVLAGMKHDFYGFAEQSADGNQIGFKYSGEVIDGNALSFEIKLNPGSGVLTNRNPQDEKDSNILKLFDAFKGKTLVSEEDRDVMKGLIIDEINSGISQNIEANNYFAANPDRLSDLYVAIDNFADTITGSFMPLDTQIDVPTSEYFVNAFNQILVDNVPQEMQD